MKKGRENALLHMCSLLTTIMDQSRMHASLGLLV